MVMEYGMSDKLGPLQFGHKEEMVFLGRDLGEQRNYSEAVAEEIDQEVRRLITQAYAKAKEILERYRDKLDEISLRLVKDETMDGHTFDAMLGLAPMDQVSGVASIRLAEPE
jgi:cell division protease FtsH